MYDKCYFCLDQLPKLKKESTASFFVNFGGAGVQKSRPTLLYFSRTLSCLDWLLCLCLAPRVAADLQHYHRHQSMMMISLSEEVISLFGKIQRIPEYS